LFRVGIKISLSNKGNNRGGGCSKDRPNEEEGKNKLEKLHNEDFHAPFFFVTKHYLGNKTK
jgi:hypothetical protein